MSSDTEVLYGQMVIGPAGSGKTTYCKTISDYLTEFNRDVILVNLDPANENVPYTAQIDIGELVKLEEVMENEKLGPNGAFLFCIDMLSTNFEWLTKRIIEEMMKSKMKISKDTSSEGSRKRPYIIFDCPGQIELYTNYPAFKSIISRLSKFEINSEGSVGNSNTSNITESWLKVDMRLVTVNIVDSHHANDPSKYITVVLNSLVSMLHIETPFINVLSKIDLIEQYGKTDFRIDYYCELPDLSRLVEMISDDPFLKKYKKLTNSLAEIIENYGLVSYVPLDINKREMLCNVLNLVDKANGFYISDMSSNQDVLNYYRSIQADFEATKYNELL